MMRSSAEATKLAELEQKTQQEWRSVFTHSHDDLMLHARVYGPYNDLPPVVCLPDMIQNAKSFHALAVYLSQTAEPTRQVVCIDYRGRGQSQHDSNWKNYCIEVEAQDLLTFLARLDIGHAHFIANMRGGLIIFLLTTLRPAMISSVILNDVGPEIDTTGLARFKFLAKQLKSLTTHQSVIHALKTVNGAHFPGLTPTDWMEQASQLLSSHKQEFRLDFDKRLVNIVDFLNFSQSFPSFWRQFEALCKTPTLVIRGEHSDILNAETMDTMKMLQFRLLDTMEVLGQGHSPLLSDFDTQEAILNFLNKADRAKK